MQPDAEQNQNASFVINNACFDVISIIHAKSKALDAYEKYFQDLMADTQLRQILIEIRHDDQRHIARLKNHLGRLLVDGATIGTTDPEQRQKNAGSGATTGPGAVRGDESSQGDFSPPKSTSRTTENMPLGDQSKL
ncbi:MAG: hypothetical protein K2X77_14420 [Candidatus Obscuribacterales bacterium]|jgi:hypothetical protein|nr:hypothetical protein [Candidatus Obscuribacterales bacterium]